MEYQEIPGLEQAHAQLMEQLKAVQAKALEYLQAGVSGAHTGPEQSQQLQVILTQLQLIEQQQKGIEQVMTAQKQLQALLSGDLSPMASIKAQQAASLPAFKPVSLDTISAGIPAGPALTNQPATHQMTMSQRRAWASNPKKQDEDEAEYRLANLKPKVVASGGFTGFKVAKDLTFMDFSHKEEENNDF